MIRAGQATRPPTAPTSPLLAPALEADAEPDQFEASLSEEGASLI